MNIDSFTGSAARGQIWSRSGASTQTWRWWHDLVSTSLIVVWAALALGLVYRAPQPQRIDIGSSYGRAYTRGFNAPERNQTYTYAFTSGPAQIFVGGAGGGAFDTVLRLNGWRPPGVERARVSITARDAALTFVPAETERSYHVLMPASNGDLEIRIFSNTFRLGQDDPRTLGIPIDSFAASATTGTPPLRAGLMVLIIAVALYALARRLDIPPGISALLSLLVISGVLYGLLATRLLVSVGLVRWLVVLLGLHVALWPLRPLVRALYHRSGVPLSGVEESWLWRIAAVATLVKLGGMLYPHIIVFDQAAHVIRMKWVLEGRFMELYRPGYTSFMGETVGLGSGQFPYSPLWHLIVVPFHFLQIGLADATNGLSAIMDVSKLFPIHLIARVTLGVHRPALFAAALYHLLPMPYYLLSWGNYPTQFGLWAALLATAFLVVHYERFGSRRTFGLWIALLALAILSYTVLGVFTVTLFGLIGLLGLVQRNGLGGKRLRFIVAGMVVAELFCFAIYHVQFAQALVRDTLPAVVSGTADRLDNPLDITAEARENPLANVDANNKFAASHFTPLGLVLAALGAIVLGQDRRARRWWPLWVAWIGVFVLYTLVSAYVADMVLKHVFFIMPLVCIAIAAVLDRWWRHSAFGRAAVLAVLIFFTAECVERGYFYLLVKRHFI